MNRFERRVEAVEKRIGAGAAKNRVQVVIYDPATGPGEDYAGDASVVVLIPDNGRDNLNGGPKR